MFKKKASVSLESHTEINETNQIFPKLYEVDNVDNKGLHGEEKNIFSQKITPNGD